MVGSYTKKNSAGSSPPVVVTRRPLDRLEPPIREPSIPAHKRIGATRARLDAKKLTPHSVLDDDDDVVVTDGEADNIESREPRPPPRTAHLKSSEQMWDYILPFLSVHKSLPEINWARHIIHLARVRDIKWNEERNKDHPYKDSHPRDITALIVQVTGVESPTPCDNCAQGKGPFIGCIQISPAASVEAKGAVLSCANCK